MLYFIYVEGVHAHKQCKISAYLPMITECLAHTPPIEARMKCVSRSNHRQKQSLGSTTFAPRTILYNSPNVLAHIKYPNLTCKDTTLTKIYPQ